MKSYKLFITTERRIIILSQRGKPDLVIQYQVARPKNHTYTNNTKLDSAGRIDIFINYNIGNDNLKDSMNFRGS